MNDSVQSIPIDKLHHTAEGVEENRTLKKGSVSPALSVILAITAAAPAMCISGAIGLIMGGVGLAAPLAFLIATIAIFLISISYTRLSSRYNSAGGSYSYVRAVMGGKAGWWTGWLYIGITISAGCVGSIFATHIHSIFPGIPLWLGVIIIAVPTILVGWFGIQLSSKAVVGLWLVQMVLFILPAVLTLISLFHDIPSFHSQVAATWVPEFGFSGLAMGVLFCMWSFVGFEVPAYLGEEIIGGSKSIQKAIPIAAIAIGLCFVICSWLWVVAIDSTTLSVLLNSETALLDFMNIIKSPIGEVLIIASVAVACVTCWFSFITAMLRMLFDMGRSKALPSAFAKLNAHSSPSFGLLLISAVWIIVSLIGAYFSIDIILGMLSSLACLAYICVSLSNIVDNWHSKGKSAIFLSKIIPTIAIAILFWMLISQSTINLLMVIMWGVVGIVIIFVIQSVKGKDFFRKMDL